MRLEVFTKSFDAFTEVSRVVTSTVNQSWL